MHNHGVGGELVVALDVGADIGPVLAHPLVGLLLLVLDLHPAAEGAELAGDGHERHRLLSEQVPGGQLTVAVRQMILDIR